MMKDILNKSKSLESSPSSEQQPHSKPVVNYRVGTFDASPPSTCDEPNQHFHKTVHTIYGLWSASDDKIPMKDLESWQKWNADWELVIHGREESDALVGSEAFKWLQPIYKKANKIQQADLLRLLFVYEYGGVYTVKKKKKNS